MDNDAFEKQMRSLEYFHTLRLLASTWVAGLKQISSPNKAQSRFISGEYVPILIQPLHKTERHGCPKRL